MALTIKTASDPVKVEQLCIVIYAVPGIGKTSLGFTAEVPLLLDFDGGVHRAHGRKNYAEITSWKDVTRLTSEDLGQFKTIIVDTVGKALDMLTVHIIEDDQRLSKNGILTQQGWGQLKYQFVTWLSVLRTLGKDIVLIAHGMEKQEGEETLIRLDVQGGSKNEIYKGADAIGLMYVDGKKRMISFDPSNTAFGKNPARLPPTVIPFSDSDFLAKLIQTMKDGINQISEESQAEYLKTQQYKEEISQFTTAEQFNSEIENAKKSGGTYKGILNTIANEKGFVFEKTGFVEKK